jgi:hypothetical protein
MRPAVSETEYLAAGCHGKLAFWPEYLDVNVGLPVSRAFRDWIRDGRQAAGMGSESADGRVPLETSRLRFVFAPSGTSELLAGVIRPSADIGGKRSFPFTVFAHIPRRSWTRSYSLLPMALEPVWDALDDIWDSLATVTSQQAFREILDSARVPGPAAVAMVKGAYEAGQDQAAKRTFESGDGASVDSLRVNLPEMLKALKSNPSQVRLELPVSVDQESATYDAAFWVDLFNHQFFWKRFEPTIFLEGSPKQPDRKVFLLFGDPQPGDYARVMGMASAQGAFQRPAHSPTGSAPPPDASTPTYSQLTSTRFVV